MVDLVCVRPKLEKFSLSHQLNHCLKSVSPENIEHDTLQMKNCQNSWKIQYNFTFLYRHNTFTVTMNKEQLLLFITSFTEQHDTTDLYKRKLTFECDQSCFSLHLQLSSLQASACTWLQTRNILPSAQRQCLGSEKQIKQIS